MPLDLPGHPSRLMGEALVEGTDSLPRGLIRVAEPFHAITYYSQEMADLRSEGYKGWWHAYFAYRPAPLGPVSAGAVTALFYNFAPRMVERAVPGVWDVRSAPDTTALRFDRVTQSLTRIFRADGAPGREVADASLVAEAAALITEAMAECSAAGHPVYAAYAELDWPTDDLDALWHGCTLVRELRGDSHNIALAAAGVDGVECHVLMAGRGHGNRPTITAIRGWTDDEWDAAVARLVDRGWAEPDGALTDDGREARSRVERHTDQLSAEPIRRLGQDRAARLIELLAPLAEHLATSGEVSGRWPPEHLLKPAS